MKTYRLNIYVIVGETLLEVQESWNNDEQELINIGKRWASDPRYKAIISEFKLIDAKMVTIG